MMHARDEAIKTIEKINNVNDDDNKLEGKQDGVTFNLPPFFLSPSLPPSLLLPLLPS